MGIISRIFRALGEITRLAHTLFTNGVHFITLSARSRTALAAENLFHRKQLADLDKSIRKLGLRVLKSPYRSPLANCFCERVVGTLRRESGHRQVDPAVIRGG